MNDGTVRSHRSALGVALALLVAHALLALEAARRIGVTTDEPVGIAGGFALLTRREMRINVEHPPLPKTLAALPLLGWHPPIDASDPDYQAGREWVYARRFLFRSGRDADATLLRCRSAVLSLSCILGAAIFLVARRLHGAAGACLALAFYAFDPAFLGHGPIVQSDVALSLFLFAAVISFLAALRSGGWGRYAAAGLLFGLGLATKLTAGATVVLWAALAIHERRRARRVLPGTLGALALAALVLVACYGVVLVPDLLRGTVWQIAHARGGHPSFFWGAVRQRGAILYFPVVFLLKTPIETLLAIVAAAEVALRRGADPRARACLLCAGLFFLALLPSTVNIGHRYLLPLYPFLYIAIGGLARRVGTMHPPKVLLGFSLAFTLAGHSLLVFPDYIGFTNALAGERPERAMANSNLDWGQDLPRLARYLRDDVPPGRRVYLAYAGQDSPEYRGIQALPAPPVRKPGLYACSINCYVGVQPERDPTLYAWLRSEKVVDRVGTSILVIDVSEERHRNDP